MKKILCFLLPVMIISFSLFSQTHLSLELNDPIYMLLEIGEIKGAINRLSLAKPYSQSTVISYLKTMQGANGAMLPEEIAIIDHELTRFNEKDNSFFKPVYSDKGFLGSVQGGLNEETQVNLNFNELSAWHMYNAIRFFLKGDILDFMSYYGCFAGTFDKVGPDSFAPYEFTKQWDGFHIGFSAARYSLGVGAVPYFSFLIEDEMTAQFFDDHLSLSFSKFRRDWGPGDGNLYLSGTARPYQGIDLQARLSSWCNLSWTAGSLTDWLRENQNKGIESFQKMVTIQMLEFFPFDWLYLNMAATALWAKRFELTYLSPLLFPIIAQNTMGDFDNVTQAVNVIAFIPGYAKFYFSFFADEMEFSSIEAMFTRPRNMFAFQLGTKVPIPFVPLTLFTFQYTKIEPFVYAHYPEQDLIPLGHPTDMSYTNDGENLGFHTPPNSDEILVKVVSMVVPDLMLSLAYRLIRHGTNSGTDADLKIFGDVNIPLNYSLGVDSYPNKDFLNDGLYDWNNIVTIGAHYRLSRYYITFSCEYTFAYTFWVPNSSGMTAPGDTMQNIVSFTFSYAK